MPGGKKEENMKREKLKPSWLGVEVGVGLGLGLDGVARHRYTEGPPVVQARGWAVEGRISSEALGLPDR